MSDNAGASEQRLDALLAIDDTAGVQRASGVLAAPIAAANATADPGEIISVNQLRMEFIRSIQAGMMVADDIFTESGTLLLAAGSRITPRFLQTLRDKGIKRVRIGTPGQPRPDAAELRTAGPATDPLQSVRSQSLDRRLAAAVNAPIEMHAVQPWRRPRLPIDDLKNEAVRGVERHQATTIAIADLCDAIQAGRRLSLGQLRQAVTQFVNMASADFDLLPLIVSLKQTQDEYLYYHCVDVALLSLSMASQLGMNREHVADVALGGLLQDIGMLRVPESIRLATTHLGQREWQEIHRHPLHTLDMLADLNGIPQQVRYMAYQAHERMDGGGYPRQRSAGQLHMFARLIAIADVYAAMTHDRPYRQAHPPYEASKTVLLDAHANRLDKALVRAFLDTVALFPIGSGVVLSDGSPAVVLRANPGLHTRPVVECVTPDGLRTGRILDLGDDDALRVVKAR